MSDPFPTPAAPQRRRLKVYPEGLPHTKLDGKGDSGEGFLSVYLEVPDAETLPSGWSQHADFSLTLLNQTGGECSAQLGPTSHTFKETDSDWGYTKFLKLTQLNDMSKGYIVNDTLLIKCDMTNISSSALTAGMYPAGNGGLLYISAGTLANCKKPFDAT